MIAEIEELKCIRKEKSALEEKERRLARPVLFDQSKIPYIYDIFRTRHNSNTVMERKVFLFVVIYLYTPSTLAGGKMKCGIRNIISQLIGCKQTLVSHSCENLLFYYKLYPSFKNDVDTLYNEVMKKLCMKNNHI